MRQPSLFDSPAAPAEPRPVNEALVRKHLRATLREMRQADIMPWHEAAARSQQQRFPDYARLLPAEEAAELIAEFNSQWERLSRR